MSSNVTDPANGSIATTGDATMTSPKSKGKSKAQATDEPMHEEVEHDEEDEEGEEEDDDGDDDEEEEEEETYEEIDPSLIRGRRTRGGARVDYASKEALDKAGLTQKEVEVDDDDDDVSMG